MASNTDPSASIRFVMLSSFALYHVKAAHLVKAALFKAALQQQVDTLPKSKSLPAELDALASTYISSSGIIANDYDR